MDYEKNVGTKEAEYISLARKMAQEINMQDHGKRTEMLCVIRDDIASFMQSERDEAHGKHEFLCKHFDTFKSELYNNNVKSSR